jgi:hypothetical protein
MSPDAVDIGGEIVTDLRFATDDAATVPFPQEPLATPQPIPWSRTSLRVDGVARQDRFRAVFDVEGILLGAPQHGFDLSGLSDPLVVDPVRVEVDALYIEARDLLWKGMDLRVGQQLVQFGVGDQFNPTNTVNPNDVEDPLRFGEQAGNLMVRVDMSRGMTTLTGVLVPVMKPALLPASAPLGLSAIERLPFVDEDLRYRLHAEKGSAEDFGYPTVVGSTSVEPPRPHPANMSGFVRVGTTVGSQDLGLSFYQGFADTPVATATHTVQLVEPQCNPDRPSECIDGVLSNDVTLRFPRMRVGGFNAAGELPLPAQLPALGWRAEIAVVQPYEVRSAITNDEISLLGIVTPAGTYPYPDGEEPVVLEGTPYPKWTLGLDYSFGAHVYANIQWVHGMFDELGAGDNLLQEGRAVRDAWMAEGSVPAICALAQDGTACAVEVTRARQSDLAVVGIDIRFRAQRGLLRLFTIQDLTGIALEEPSEDGLERVVTRIGAFAPRARSMVLYPELSYGVGGGMHVAGGALVQTGRDWTKFGDPAAGGSFVYARAGMSF